MSVGFMFSGAWLISRRNILDVPLGVFGKQRKAPLAWQRLYSGQGRHRLGLGWPRILRDFQVDAVSERKPQEPGTL